MTWELLSYLAKQGKVGANHVDAWVREVSAIFGEENVYYRVDQKGSVHLAVDQEFEANRVATLAHLEAPRYANVARNFDEAHDRLSEVPPQGKNAIRAIFGAVEGLFRLMFPNEDRLTAKAAKTRLAATVQRKYQGNAPALGAASKPNSGARRVGRQRTLLPA